MMRSGRHASAQEREAWRKRWRAFLLPHWKRLENQVLDEREARVLALRLGIVGDVGLSHSVIARRLHLSSGSISVIEKRALMKVRATLNTTEAT